MITSKCPCCHESVTVPDAPRHARVRCPLCQEEYTLADVLERCPPLLELLDAHAAPSGLDEPLSELAPVGAGVEMKEQAPPSFDFNESPAPQAAAVSTTPSVPRSTTVARRPRRKPKNPIVEVVKIVGGGVVGLFVAQMILWWMPFNLQVGQRDPFSLGRNIGEYFPWIVPEQVRAAAAPSSAENPTGSNSTAAQNGNGTAPAGKQSRQTSLAGRQESGQPKNGGLTNLGPNNGGLNNGGLGGLANNGPGNGALENGDLTNGLAGGAQLNPGAGTGADDDFSLGGLEPSLGGASPNPLSGLDSDPLKIDVLPLSPPPTTPTPGTPSTTPAAPPSITPALPPSGGTQKQRIGFKAPPSRTAEDVAAVVKDVQERNAAYDAAADAPVPERLALANSLYAAMAELGSVLAHADRSKAGELQPHLQELGELITSLGPNKHAGLGRLAAGWLKQSGRGTDGVVLVGKVTAIEPLEGGYYECRIEQGGKTLPVICWTKPKFAVGAEVLTLGTIVENPTAELVDYPGGSGQIFSCAYAQVLGTP